MYLLQTERGVYEKAVVCLNCGAIILAAMADKHIETMHWGQSSDLRLKLAKMLCDFDTVLPWDHESTERAEYFKQADQILELFKE